MIYFFHVHTTIRPKYVVFLYLLFLLCTIIRRRLMALTYLFFLCAHNHLIKICGPLPFIISFVHDHSTKQIRVLIYIFISFVHVHSTKIKGHSYSLIYSLIHTFQLSRFERETLVLRGCLPSSRLISKSPVLRETSANFQFFLKIPICIASYFVFWCFNCVTAIDNVKNTL